MSKGKTRLGLVGLCVTAAMAMMAFAASGAQAASWLVAGATVTANLPVELVITSDTPTRLMSKAVGDEIEIECKEYEAKNAVLKSGGVATGEVWFKNCETFIKEPGKEFKLTGACKPVEPIKAGGTLEAKKVGTTDEIKATGAGGVFTIINLGPECAVGEEFEVTGTAWIKDCEGKALVDQLIHLIEEDMTQALAAGGLKFGEEPASILGSVKVELFDSGMKTFAIHG